MLRLENELNTIKQAGLYRKLISVGSQSGPKVVVDGREVLMMASNDYLGLCAHPRMKAAALQATEQWGTGSGAARLISGNVGPFTVLEKRLAAFKETEAALVFSTGYMANQGLLGTLAGKDDIIYSDELNHASIIDGCRLSRAQTAVYPHRDTAALEGLLLQGERYRRRIIVTDGVFSMDGDLAPVPELAALADKYDAHLVIDDAHGTGAAGSRGRGTLEHFGMQGHGDVTVMGTMGKAMGSFGAFVAGSEQLKEFLINRARSFIFTTALPPAVAAASGEALSILDDEPERIARLQENAAFMREGLTRLGFNTLGSATQIIPVFIGEVETALAMAGDLVEQNVFLLAIRPPTVPEGTARLRLTVMADHARDDLARVLDVLEKTGRRYNVI